MAGDQQIEASTPARSLAVFAHPDDPEVSCGGTLARWAAAGSEVHLVVANRGDKGSPDPATDPDGLAEHRAGEVLEAAEVLGLAGVDLLGYPDGELEDDAELRGRLVAIIRRLRPDAVVAPDPTAVFFGESYVNHRDHRNLGWAVLDALVPAASPLYLPEAGEAHHVGLVLLSGTLEPSAWVDIHEHLDQKVAAVACHQSRLGDDPQIVAAVLAERAAEEGRRCGLAHAEAFRRLRFAV
ncbi:MAG: PIG-L deacetylase family protein [Acidimicrobiia bacterium]|jgi:LmbE family N-acetylglucosaminyl deacetylase